MVSNHCGTRMWRAGWGYAKIILVMAENAKKGVKIKTQRQSYRISI